MAEKPTYEELAQRVKDLEKETLRRRRAEEELQDSKNFLSNIFSSIQDGISILDNEYNIIRVNHAMEEWYSHVMPLVGKKCYEAYHERDKPCKVCPVYKTLATSQAAHEVVPKRGSGSKIVGWLDLFSFPLFDKATGQIIGVIEYVRDITERKQAEETLRVSEERFRLTLDATSDGVWDHNLITGKTYYGKNWARILGYTAEDMKNPSLSWKSLLHPDDKPRALAAVSDNLSGRTDQYIVEFRLRNKTGGWQWILSRGKVVEWDENGKPLRYVGTHKDITDRKRAEEALLESEKRLSQIIHGNSVATFVIDNNHKITHWNMACEKLTGVSAEEMLGTQNQWGPFYNKKRPVMADLVVDNAPDDKITEYYSSKYQCSTIIEGAYEGEDFFPQVGDTGKWLFFTAAPLKDANGKIFGAIEIFQDITGRKLAEEALRQSEEKFRSIFEITGAAIATFLPEGNFLEVNPALCKLLGYTEAELLNLKVEDITHPDDRNRTRLSYDEIKAGQRQSFNYEKRYLCKDGSTVWGHVDVACVFGTTSKPMYCVGLMQDITAGKLAEVALQSSRKMLQAVLDTIPVRVFWKDRDLRYLGCNINFAKDAGLDLPEAIIGKDDYQLSWREQAEMYRADDRQIIESGIPKLNYEEPMVWPDGTSLWLKTSKIPLQDNLGNIFGVLGCYEDITERKKMEQALQTAHDELEKRVEKRTAQLKVTHDQLLHSEKLSAIGKLSASIAHEFNNPLFGIRNVLGGIKKRADLDEEDAELVDMALQECDRIKYLIHDLRDFNRPTSGVMAPMDMHEAIDSILLLLKKEFKNKKIKVQKDYTAKMPNICAVGDQMKQVLLNMLNNASDAISASGGTITIITHLLNKMIAIHIQDTGAGIKPEDMDHIFEPFFTTKPEVKGTGLGLSVSYGIIKRHGGRIDVNSEVGKGSIFTIILPIEEAS